MSTTTESVSAPLSEDLVFEIPAKFTKSGRRKAVPLPYKLMYIITHKEYSDMIQWQADGKSFKILLPSLFTTKVLPVHFKEAKYSSFKRKLHRWGFDRFRSTDGSQSSNWFGSEEVFCHKNFQKNRFDLLEIMVESKPMSQMNTKQPVVPKKKAAPKSKPVALPAAAFKKSPLPERNVDCTATRNRHREELHPQQMALPLPPRKRLATEEAVRAALANATAAAAIAPTFSSLPLNNNYPSFSSAIMEMEISRRVKEAEAAKARESKLEALMEIEIARRVRERLTSLKAQSRSMLLMQSAQRQVAQAPSVDPRGALWNTFAKASQQAKAAQNSMNLVLDDLPMNNNVMPRSA